MPHKLRFAFGEASPRRVCRCVTREHAGLFVLRARIEGAGDSSELENPAVLPASQGRLSEATISLQTTHSLYYSRCQCGSRTKSITYRLNDSKWEYLGSKPSKRAVVAPPPSDQLH